MLVREILPSWQAKERKKELKDGYLIDFISGKEIRATPEEKDAVQIFAVQLVEDYGYDKELIQTRPQWRVKARPSDNKKEYPVDIAVFSSAERIDGTEQIIVECKKKNRKDGRTQLEDYLRFCRANLGVWFNGQERLFLKKTEKDGKVFFEEIPNIPKFGQRVEDVGHFKRKDLKKAHNLKTTFKAIRNYLAANAVGITRDEVFAQQLINLVFCKIYDERFTKPKDMVTFRAGITESTKEVAKRITELFVHVKKQYNDVIEIGDQILLDDAALTYVVGELQQYCLIDSERDAIADAFETFIGPSLKGGQGQFFTPRNVVKLIVDMVTPTSECRIIDPACGSGGFLVEALRNVWKSIETDASELGWPENEIFAEKQKVAINNFRGIDKDNFLSKVAKSYMAILGDGRGGVFCENSLDSTSKWKRKSADNVRIGSFDIVVTNPPFGKKLKIDDTNILKIYNLGHKWKTDRKSDEIHKTNTLQDGQSPQILFIERCLDLLKDNGKLGIIAPESMFCNPSHRYIIQFIKSIARIRAVISLPEELFQPYTHAKTCAVMIEKKPAADEDCEIFMAVAKWCGHDSRGLEIPYDDIPYIQERYDRYMQDGKIEYDHLGFTIRESEIVDDIYLPKYYDPEIPQKLRSLKKTHELVKIKSLVDSGILEVATGDEVGKLAYGTGNIPFIRSSDIANWEIKGDPKQGLSEEIYESYRKRQDVRVNDIFMVRDGTYLVGTSAIITEMDARIVYQSHIYKIRSNDFEKLHPYLLLAVLSCPLVKQQIFAKRFTQDIIDTLGRRLYEIELPIPKKPSEIERIVTQVSEIIEAKCRAKLMTRQTVLSITPIHDFDEDGDGFMTIREIYSRPQPSLLKAAESHQQEYGKKKRKKN